MVIYSSSTVIIERLSDLWSLYAINGRRLFINRSLREALGPNAPAGFFGDRFASPDAKDAFMEAIAAGRSWRGVVEVQTTNGPRWHDMEAAPCRDAVTGDAAFHVSAVDVTDAKLASEALKIARDDAESANRAKSEFIANMSHEMRTPMNGVLGLLEVLRVSSITPEQQEIVRVAQESGMALLELIEDVLDISSAELGAVSLDAKPFDPGALARLVVDGLTTPAKQKGLELKVEICPDLPAEARGDRRRVAQVMRNLIGNAIKYTERGSILLAVDRAEDALRVAVSDTGAGIPDAQKSRIFERFYRPENAEVSLSDGVGLGLSIVKEIVELWDGDLNVEDASEGGSCFRFTVPSAFAAPALCAADVVAGENSGDAHKARWP
ncbi:MAG: ATP-binding protein [Pseudomonadota bacterium]